VDMPELRGDAGRLEADTGWTPSIAMDDTLRSLLDYWGARIKEESNSEATSNRRSE